MKSAGQTAVRLLGALEDFASREAVLLQTGQYAQMAEVQRRAGPLIFRLCALAAEPDAAALSERVAALVARRRETMLGLQERRNFVRSERQRLAATSERLRLVSHYGKSLPKLTAESFPISRARRLNAAV
jgi:hypothetical protein